ncbi:bifunctional 4-hydroxy-2-oxoglutarate aldolase/2-dehydro-3-deoxy-phosphogluconate aldolase [Thermosynechococcus vestitus]|uniref:2-dehydro-3-deoxyphosphogluconate aldolase / 4-hydroxy-2-oxoglutarate aldolase n=1 Tax=Thermosynechococcus vestitus (strain NIES-2133 / IAM M-273 / BP-1) TaxID=197221 RepID=Q8DHL9_THEVB|nr:bifunctional 4-hydroxy-2-oxoglutarate aldolase/2-dehydro-3-deoxy-phosphogluconate aldolase [Thermosynechococcus vestitus]BAC09480.1 2-dehydro-3-deoxyphosphogluconate aldolase / 4-hydroxy-2-oxoglutarate aldolase [Thermosynechococcus vestitus BP-1]
MPKLQQLEFLQGLPLIAVVRAATPTAAIARAQVYLQAGFTSLEVTWTIPDAPSVLQQLRQDYPHCTIGAASLQNPQMLKEAIAAGAQFLVTPHTAIEVVSVAKDANCPLILGALTPTEVLHAWQSGATAVKVFPIMAVGGASYLQALRPLFAEIPLIPCGGIGWEDLVPLWRAGAIAIAMGSQLGTDLTKLKQQVAQAHQAYQALGQE